MAYIRFAVLTTAFLLVNIFSGFAQKSSEYKRLGEKYFENRRWEDAFLSLSQYQLEKPGNLDVLTKLGICSYHLHDADKSRQYFEYIIQREPEKADPEVYFYLGRLLHGQQDFKKAIVFYKLFLKNAPEKHLLRNNTIDNIKRCVSGTNTKPNDAVALVENMGEKVNSKGDEFGPIPSVNHNNRLYYSAARPGAAGGLRNDEGMEDSLSGFWCSDMFFTSLSNKGWDWATELGSLLNTPRNEMALDFRSDGKVLFYFRGFSLYSGEMFADTAGIKDEYRVEIPTFKSPVEMENGDQSPIFHNDSILIFASRRKGGMGGLDLYFSRISNGEWDVPRNFGEPINTPYDETTPYLAPDGRTLFFSSNNTQSIGGLDVFKTFFDDKKRVWQAPVNMGLGVNSPGDDAFFRISKDGKNAYLASDRFDSFGERDLYMVYFKESAPASNSGKNIFFADVKDAVVPIAAAAQQNLTPEILLIKPIQYDTDKDLTVGENLKTIQTVAENVKNYPEVTVLVNAHTDESGPTKFDLYYGIKRAEIIGKALVERGIPASRIVLKSVGPNYPIAKNVLGQEENPMGHKLNRRVEIVFAAVNNKLPIVSGIQRPAVSEIMEADGGLHFEEMTEGLSFKVEVASTRQIVTNETLDMFDDIMIESTPGTGTYQYTAGLFKTYPDALKLKAELIKQGFADAFVTAYIDGIRISKAEASRLVKKIPDLAPFIKG